MKRTRNAYWYQIGYIDGYRGETPLFIRYCKNPRLTREHKHLTKQLNSREIVGVFYRPFDPIIQGLDPYELKLTEYNF